MWATTELLRFAAAIVAVLFAALLLRDHGRNPTALASVALLAGVAAHLLFLPLLRHGAWPPVVHTVLLVSLTVPVALWLLAHLHFDDDFRFERRHAWSVVAFVTVGYVCWLGAVERRLPAFLFPAESTRFWMLLPKLLGLAVVLHALLRVYVGAGTDLVVPRLRARFAVLAVSGTYVLLELLGEVFFSGSASEAAAEAVHSAAVLALVLGVAFVSLRTASEILRVPEVALSGPAVDPELAERLKRLLETGEVFREEGLTIRSLAERLGAQEHKVRQLINAQLGFKNFNAFLNRFRVEAGEKGEITLLVNAFPAVKASEPSFLARTPTGPFAVGAGGTTRVGSYPAGLRWSGLWRTCASMSGRSAARRTGICWATGPIARAAAVTSRAVLLRAFVFARLELPPALTTIQVIR